MPLLTFHLEERESTYTYVSSKYENFLDRERSLENKFMVNLSAVVINRMHSSCNSGHLEFMVNLFKKKKRFGESSVLRKW